MITEERECWLIKVNPTLVWSWRLGPARKGELQPGDLVAVHAEHSSRRVDTSLGIVISINELPTEESTIDGNQVHVLWSPAEKLP